MASSLSMNEVGQSDEQALFDRLISEGRKDNQTVTPEGRTVKTGIDGVTFRPSPTHGDERGILSEIYDNRWSWHADPLVTCYFITIRPGYVKGWNIHQRHEDRYCLIKGEMNVVLYDTRPGSPTFGQIDEVYLSEHNRGLINIPVNLWHADHNIGQSEVILVNMPTRPYDYANPDKIRLPIDTDLIPYDFGDAKGW